MIKMYAQLCEVILRCPFCLLKPTLAFEVTMIIFAISLGYINGRSAAVWYFLYEYTLFN